MSKSEAAQPNSGHTRSRLVPAAALVAWLAFAGCSKEPQQPAMPAMPPAEVTVATVSAEPVTMTIELPGRFDAVRIAMVRARVPGLLLKRTFEEGSDVKAGDLLFQIDPAPLQASYNSAKAALAKAEANLKQTQTKVDRYKTLVEFNAVSKQDYDDATTTVLQNQAEILAAKAALETASLNLGYATVTAPISGRIGRAKTTEGALVGQGEATELATIQQLDPIYFDFTQSSADILRLRRALDSGKLKSLAPGAAKVTLLLEDGSTYQYPGKLLFSDITVDQTTGMVTVRAEFPNPERLLLPGMFARGRLEQAVVNQATTVPQRAVARGANGTATALVVGPDNKVELRTVTTDAAVGDKWVVTSGLKAGDRVIVEGLQKAAPGAVVNPVPAGNAATNAPAQAPGN